jgi:lipoyl(octanoyl) transferase
MSDRTIAILQAGCVPYLEALGWQRQLAQARIARRLPQDLLLLLEHPAVITLGRSARRDHLRSTAHDPVVEVERGGDVTYHGPGQLVGYPIIDLHGYRADLHWYLRTLEAALIRALEELGIAAERRHGLTGVWTGGRKIASIGVHVRQWVTWHGFALNVTTDLAAFDQIVPCGIPDVHMTSVAHERNGDQEHPRNPGLWAETISAVIHGFEAAFAVGATPVSPAWRNIVEECRPSREAVAAIIPADSSANDVSG